MNTLVLFGGLFLLYAGVAFSRENEKLLSMMCVIIGGFLFGFAANEIIKDSDATEPEPIKELPWNDSMTCSLMVVAVDLRKYVQATGIIATRKK